MKKEELQDPEDSGDCKQHTSQSDQAEFDNYFGLNARLNFFDRYKWLTNQTKIAGNDLVLGQEEESLELPGYRKSLGSLCPVSNNRNHLLPQLQVGKLSPPPCPALSLDDCLSSPSGMLSPLVSENKIKPPRSNSRSNTPSSGLCTSSIPSSGLLSPLSGKTSRSFHPTHDTSKKNKVYRYHANISPSGSRNASPCPSRASSPLPLESASHNSAHDHSRSLPVLRIKRGQPDKNITHGENDLIDDDDHDTCSTVSDGNLSYNSYHSRSSRDSNHSHLSYSSGKERTRFPVESIIGEDESIATITEGKKSPRTRFLLSCIQENINPRPSLLLRNNFSKKLDLHHKGMSNEFAKSLAKSLKELPFIESLNLADNRLTDEGLTPLLLQLSNLSSLNELNLSQNKVGKNAANALYDYLSSANCSLSSLILKQADIDDYESIRLIRSLFLNDGSLIDLDLSQNEIGKHENYLSTHHNNNHHHQQQHSHHHHHHHHHQNHHRKEKENTVATHFHSRSEEVHKHHHQRLHHQQDSHDYHHHENQKKGNESDFVDFKNGSYALGSFLQSSDCKLIRLNLQWNMIRLDGGINLCQSLGFNNSLIFLDLSYNSLGSQGGIAIGSSLLRNNCLETLILSYNSIDAIGCITIIAGIVENRTLNKLMLDGNPIGDQVGV
jgi:hypothetical protein